MGIPFPNGSKLCLLLLTLSSRFKVACAFSPNIQVSSLPHTLFATVTERGFEMEVGDTFFRKESQLSRDLSVLMAALYKREVGVLRVVDAYSGVGSRAARYLNQAGADFVHANDANEETHQFLEQNLRLTDHNSSAITVITHEDARRILMGYWYRKEFVDLVDCDSFGYAARAIAAALHAVRHGGLIYVTNTDGRGSAGKAPAKALAAYGSWSTYHTGVNEQGLRLLIGFAAREAASLGLEIQPLFSLYSAHGPVYRTMLRVKPCTRPDNFIQQVYRFTAHCNRCGQSSVVPWESLGAVAEISGIATSINEQKPVALPEVVRCNCTKESLLYASLSTNVAEKSERVFTAPGKGVWTRRWNRFASNLFRIKLKFPRLGVLGGGKNEARQEATIKRKKKRKLTKKDGCLQLDAMSVEPMASSSHLFNMSGPMWVASLHDLSTLEAMAALAREWGWDLTEANSAVLPTLRTMMQEADHRLPPFYLNTHELAKRAKVSPPPKRLIFSHLRKAGFLARRTHIEKFGLKTDAPMAACIESTRKAATEAAITVSDRAKKRKWEGAPKKVKTNKRRKKKGKRGAPWGTEREQPI